MTKFAKSVAFRNLMRGYTIVRDAKDGLGVNALWGKIAEFIKISAATWLLVHCIMSELIRNVLLLFFYVQETYLTYYHSTEK